MESGITERMCVIRYEERRAGFSAKARSEMKRQGRISVTLLVGGRPWFVGEKDDGGTVMGFGGVKVHC